MAKLSLYQKKLRALLSPAQRRVFERLDTPNKIQTFLDRLPENVLAKKEHTMRSPAEVLKARKAHCMEGAMLAAAALAYHGRPGYLMDLASTDNDYDHVIALFKEGGRWGAISKTNYPVLRWRDPVYASPRELAMSYFHEYFLENGKKTMRTYSTPFDLRQFDPARWATIKEDVDWLADELSDSPHFPIAPPRTLKNMRRASKIEIAATAAREWTKGGKKKYSQN